MLRLARKRGIDAKSPAYAHIEAWLETRPSDQFFDTAGEVLSAAFARG